MQITVRVFKCCCSRFDYLFFFWQKLTHILFLSASDTRHSALSRDLFALNWKRAATTNKKFHLFAHKIKNKKTEERRKKTNKETSNENKQMTSLFYFILAFRHCLNFNKLCTFFALLSAVVWFASYSSIISLSHHALLGCFSIRL